MKKSKAKKLLELKERFVKTMNEVADLLGMFPSEVLRDDYIRVSVDTDIKGRLNKEELVEIGGFARAKEDLIESQKEVPKILVFDIETSPMVAEVWGLFNQNIGLEQVLEHTTMLSYAAKYIGEDKIYYNDTFKQKNKRDDKKIIRELSKLIDQADFVLAHNGDRFDMKKVRFRILDNDLPLFSEPQTIDTLKIAKQFLGFDSNKLAHLTHKLCTKHKKLVDKKFPGHKLWREFLSGNKEAQKEMEDYNKLDILSLEELYVDHLAKFDTRTPNFSSFDSSSNLFSCNCGSTSFVHKGYHITKKSKFEKFQCTKCGKTHRSSKNLHNKAKRDSLLV